MRNVIQPGQAWHRLGRMQHMVVQEPALAWVVSFTPLQDQLNLTLELLQADGSTYLDEDPSEPSPSNVIRFRLRRQR
jgi:hypothetical protein